MSTDLQPIFTAAGLAAIAAAHGRGVALEITHVAIGDQSRAIRDKDAVPLSDARAYTALANERARTALAAGTSLSDHQVLMVGTIAAGKPEFFIKEVGFFTADEVMVAYWSDETANLGWRGDLAPWVFRFALAWSDLPARAITVQSASGGAGGGTALNNLLRDFTTHLTADDAHANRIATTDARGFVELATGDEVTAGTDDARAVTPAGLKALIPAGTIMTSAAQDPPAGWLSCDGATISRTAYAELFAVIGTTYGRGNGSTTFTLPDLRGEFIRGWDEGRGADPARQFGSTQGGSRILIDPHDNEGWLFNANHRMQAMREEMGLDPTSSTIPDWITLISIPKNPNPRSNLEIYQRAENWSMTRPRNIALTFCIKY
ncbi:MAG: tail fiber protein [Pseudomonadota bacterium]